MDAADKRKQRRRHIRGMKRARTWQELKELKQRGRQRAAERKARPARRRDWLDAPEEPAGRGRMGARRAAPLRQQADPAAPVPDLGEVSALAEGLVVEVVRGGAVVQGEAGLVPVELPSRRDQLPDVVVGDRVLVERLGADAMRIAEVLDRHTWLSRPDPSCAHRERVIAANVDKAVVVVSVVAPPFKPGLVDRYLVALRRGRVRPVVAINKADRLPDAADRETVEAQLAHQREAGVPLLWVAATTGEGMAGLATAIERSTCVFVGQSGVGKSSLLNVLDPTGERRTGAERATDGKGRHTTAGSRLVTLDDGTRLVDTPGVRAFGLWADDRSDLGAAFPDLEALATGCRFSDCQHGAEPDCAVRAAVEEGRLESSRLAAWARMIGSLG